MPAQRINVHPNLRDLLEGIAVVAPIAITGIESDSRSLQKGDAFFAMAGVASHGIEYVQQAVDAGVAAIIYDTDTSAVPAIDTTIPVVAVAGLQQHLGTIANRWYGYPSESVAVTGVTGTNGKTTVALLLAQCLQILDTQCGYVGTLGKGMSELEFNDGLTTPSCFQLHKTLAEFRDAGASQAVIEVSSHALSQGRTDGMNFRSAIFTNLSRDHIDYHGDMQRYFEAKAGLFVSGTSENHIINIDSEYGRLLADRIGQSAILVTTQDAVMESGRTFVSVRQIEKDSAGSRIEISTNDGSAETSLQLLGEFNVSNAAMVIAELLRQGISLQQVADVIAEASAPTGRMQRVNASQPDALPAVFVDYAHTPDGLEVALTALRGHCDGQLWCVFGCGGDRDEGKRPQMGEVVSRLADRAIVTSDNPRGEDPQSIIDDITKGMSGSYDTVEDRATAIALATSMAAIDDLVLIAGKGHEDVQIIKDQRIPFSDYASAQANLEARIQKGKGPQ